MELSKEITELLAGYDVVDGKIRSPGKFEGEPIYAPYFHEALLNGDADMSDGEDGWALFEVYEEDVEEFPELLKNVAVVMLRVDDNGFVHTMTQLGEPKKARPMAMTTEGALQTFTDDPEEYIDLARDL